MADDEITFTPVNGEEEQSDFSITPPHMDDEIAQRAVAAAYLLQTTDELSDDQLKEHGIRVLEALTASIPKAEPKLRRV